MRVLRILAINLVTITSTSAFAECSGQIFGPIGSNSQFYYSSTCFSTPPDRIIIKAEVCSVSSPRMVFNWTRLNWVSGSTGVQFGDCLVRKMYSSDAIKIGGSKLTTNVAQSEITDVYLPALGKDENKPYFDTIEGGGPRIEEGSHEPFYFEVAYAPENDKHVVHIRATMSGEDPVFYIVLPQSVTSIETLKSFVADAYVDKIAPLVMFGSILPGSKIGEKDTQLAEFVDHHQFSKRGEVVVQDKQIATISFDAVGSVKSVVPSLTIELGSRIWTGR
jgi:hypothetical protein